MARKIGFLHTGSKASFEKHFAAFVDRLHDFVEQEDVKIEERWASDDTSKTLQGHAKDLSDANVSVIVAAGGPPSALAAKKATSKSRIAVAFTSVTDPVGLGLVKSLDNPGGNLTGVAGLTSELDVTRLELLREFLADGKPARVGVLNNRNRPGLDGQFQKLADAAGGLKFTLVRKDAADLAEIEAAFADFKGGGKKGKGGKAVDAVLVTANSLFNDLRAHVVGLATGVPAIFQWREFAEAGGLMSYGPDIIDAYEQVADYVGHILDGEEPSDLPVMLPDRFDLVINVKTAHAEGFRIPALLMSRADFVRRRLRTRRSAELAAPTRPRKGKKRK